MSARSAAQPVGRRLAGAALVLSASFVVSRALGLLRNVLIADIFTRHATDAYFAAFRIPDTMYTLVSGGALASAFVPVFAGLIEQRREADAWRVASTVINTVFLALAAFGIVAFVLAPQIMSLLVQNFTGSEMQTAVELTRIMLLQPIFLGVQAVVTSILQTYNRFTLTAFAPLVYTVAGIIGALLGRTYGVSALAWSIVIGALAYLAVQVPGLLPELRWRPSINWDLPATREVVRLFVPRVVGLAAFQGMLLITLFLAGRLPAGSITAINFAWVVIWAPVTALGTAAATAVFPTLSRLHTAEEFWALRSTVHRGLSLVLFLAVPAAVGLIVLRRPVVNLLFHRGNWTDLATEQTAWALMFYAMALPALSAIEVLPRVFYAMRETVTPVRIAIVAVTIDAVLSVVFVHLFPRDQGQGGLALATAIASSLQAVWLVAALQRRVGSIGAPVLLAALRDAAISSLAMAIVMYVVLRGLAAFIPDAGFGALTITVVAGGIGLMVFAWIAWLLGAPELEVVAAMMPRQRRRRGKP